MTAMPITPAPEPLNSRDMLRYLTPVPFRRLVRVQLRIWRAQRGVVASTIAVTAISLAATAAGMATHHGSFTARALGQEFASSGGGAAMLWLVVGAIAGAAPFRSGWAGVMLAIAPRRLRWFTACLFSVLVWTAVAATAFGGLACAAAAAVLAAHHRPLAACAGVAVAIGPVVAGALLTAAVGFTLGAAARGVTLAIVLGLVVAPLAPLLNSAPGHPGQWLDLGAAASAVSGAPGSPHWGLPVMTACCLWVAVPALVATWRLTRSPVA